MAATALLSVLTLAVPACGGSVPGGTAAPLTNRATHDVATAPDPCATVTVTTPIEQVTPACQVRWTPYGVTEVPPSNELELEDVLRLRAWST